ncbi:hypothetical protein DL93DRAFT_2167053 [Clavulina sp. PMI_390]|nr:hypothetical protein DL93DRAFT_2167053 [Clavulina sp. PMI_390]
MVSFTSLSVLLVSTLAAVQAAPLNRRIVGTEKCTTVATGNLRTSKGVELGFVGSTLEFGGPLEVEFQSCTPNFGGYTGTDNTPIEGHIYIPSTGKCLTTNSATSASGPPFVFEQDDCYYSDDSGQFSSSFIKQSDGSIYYAGVTQADGSIIAWGDVCKSGYFGVLSTQTDGVATMSCVDNGDIIGLNI